MVLPLERHRKVLAETYDRAQAGHFGVKKTYHRLAETYYWPRMHADVVEYV